jgi:hypothetical protein
MPKRAPSRPDRMWAPISWWQRRSMIHHLAGPTGYDQRMRSVPFRATPRQDPGGWPLVLPPGSLDATGKPRSSHATHNQSLMRVERRDLIFEMSDYKTADLSEPFDARIEVHDAITGRMACFPAHLGTFRRRHGLRRPPWRSVWKGPRAAQTWYGVMGPLTLSPARKRRPAILILSRLLPRTGCSDMPSPSLGRWMPTGPCLLQEGGLGMPGMARAFTASRYWLRVTHRLCRSRSGRSRPRLP